MTFAKFMSLLVKRSLWFSRIDKFDDPFEGKYPKETILRYGPPPLNDNITDVENARQWMYANCWYISDHESAAMWQLYSSSNEAIALQSTYELLHLNLPENSYVGEIQYIDFERDFIDILNMFTPFMHKRLSFAHERELRALIEDFETPSIPTDRPDTFEHDYEMVNPLAGIEVTVDIHHLVERIYVAPTAQPWFKGVVRRVAIDHGFTESQIVASSLDEVPY